MKSLTLALASFLIANVDADGTSSLRGSGSISSSSLIGKSKNKYELKKVFEVEGRQGITTNGTHYWNSASKGLYLYDMEGNLLNKNENPFEGMDPPVNHFGDINYYNGKLFTGVEWFEDGRGQDISNILYDPDTLNATETFPWNEDSGQVEASAIAVDADNELVWMTDWVESNYIYAYNLEDGEYVDKLHLRATPTWTQGIAFYKGDAYVTADDGDADRKEDDNIWRIDSEDLHNNATYIHHEMAFPGLDYGEIEGLDFNKETNELIVLANRGQRIVLGMPKDYYPGYDREIHEVYVYSIIDEEDETESSAIA